MGVSKDQLNKLVQQLSDEALPIAAEFLEVLVSHPKYRHIPWDDEPTTQEDIDAIKAAREAFEKGELISLKDIEHELRN